MKSGAVLTSSGMHAQSLASGRRLVKYLAEDGNTIPVNCFNVHEHASGQYDKQPRVVSYIVACDFTDSRVRGTGSEYHQSGLHAGDGGRSPQAGISDCVGSSALRVSAACLAPPYCASRRLAPSSPPLYKLCTWILHNSNLLPLHDLHNAMAIGRLAHYAFDAVLLSTVLAGVRRSSGFTSVHIATLVVLFGLNMSIVLRFLVPRQIPSVTQQ